MIKAYNKASNSAMFYCKTYRVDATHVLEHPKLIELRSSFMVCFYLKRMIQDVFEKHWCPWHQSPNSFERSIL